jgi:hypothetical protein
VGAKESIQNYVAEELPIQYQNTLVGINQVIAKLWDSIESHASLNERDRNNNMSLLLQAYGMRLELLSSAETLKHTVNFVDSFTNDKRDSLTNGKRYDSGVTKKEDNKNVQKVNNEIDNKQCEHTEKPAGAPERILDNEPFFIKDYKSSPPYPYDIQFVFLQDVRLP